MLISAAALQAELIIPKSPSRDNIEEAAVENLTPEEMREIIRSQRVWSACIGSSVTNEIRRTQPRPKTIYQT